MGATRVQCNHALRTLRWLCVYTIAVVGLSERSQPAPPHLVFIVADDLGYNDLGATNGGLTHTPNIDALRNEGLVLSSYHTFKICSPSRASMFTGRYPWGAGFYDMTNDEEHTTTNFTIWPGALKDAGYATAAIGKWDNGMVLLNSTPTFRGFDRFFGYYVAAQGHYWYHDMGGLGAGCGPAQLNDSRLFDFSDSVGEAVRPASPSINGTYNTELFAARAEQWIADAATTPSQPFALYFAPMNVHASGGPYMAANVSGLQAPLGTILEFYNYTTLDTYKVAGGMLTELDGAVGRVVAALKNGSLYDSTLIVFVSDNGGPLDHATNFPLRGGKHTFWEGGVHVTGFLSGGALPASRRGQTWDGLMHASDWYQTLIAGVAGAPIPPTPPGSRPLDGLNLWQALVSGGPSPRTEIIHQVNNSYFSEGVSAITMGEMKLIRGPPGDNRTLAWPALSPVAVPLGLSGASIEPGTDHVSCQGSEKPLNGRCEPWCLFNLTADPGESNNLCCGPDATTIAVALIARLDEEGATGPPNSWTYGTDEKKVKAVLGDICDRAIRQRKNCATIEPFDWNNSAVPAGCHFSNP